MEMNQIVIFDILNRTSLNTNKCLRFLTFGSVGLKSILYKICLFTDNESRSKNDIYCHKTMKSQLQ